MYAWSIGYMKIKQYLNSPYNLATSLGRRRRDEQEKRS